MKNPLIAQTLYWLKICLIPSIVVMVLLSLNDGDSKFKGGSYSDSIQQHAD